MTYCYDQEVSEGIRIIVTIVWAFALLFLIVGSMFCIAELKDCLITPEVVIINKLMGVSQ